MNMIFKLNLANEPHEVLVYNCQKEPYHTIVLGKGSYISTSTMHLGGGRKGNISIGNYTSIASECFFLMGMNHDYSSVTTYPFEDIIQDRGATNHYVNSNHYQIIIGHDVWIGQHVTIMGGVRIGNGAVIAAHSVVTRDVPPYAIVGGIPARIIKYRFPSNIIQKIQSVKWWYWDIETITKNLDKMKNPQIFVEEYYKEFINNNPPLVLKKLKEHGEIIFFLADLENEDGIYNDVIKQYSAFIKVHPGYILLVGVEKKYQQLGENVLEESCIDNNKVYIYYYDIKDGYKEVLSVSSFMVSNGEKIFMKYYDYATDYKVKILNGFDADVFQPLKKESNKRGQPVLTIGIPTYNRLKYLQKCLKNILLAVGNDKRVEIFVSDNCSKKDVEKYVMSQQVNFGNLIYVRHDKNIGGTANAEYVLKKASGKYTWVMGDDDYFCIKAIKEIVNVLSIDTNISLLALLSSNKDYDFITLEGIDSFVKNVSINMTAFAACIYRSDLIDIEEFKSKKNSDDVLSKTLISQVALRLELLLKNNSYGMLLGELFAKGNGEAVCITEEKYNELAHSYGFPDLGNVFINDYFYILNLYKKYGITDATIKHDKKQVLQTMIIPWCKMITAKSVRWKANNVLYWYDYYYRDEVYYNEGRKYLSEILKGVDNSIKENQSDLVDYLSNQ